MSPQPGRRTGRLTAVLLVALLLPVSMLPACSPPVAPGLPATANITPGETQVLAGLRLQFVEALPGAPCPEDADCQTGGPGRILVAVEAGGQAAELQLSTAGGRGQAVDFQGYRLRLLSLEAHDQYGFLAAIRVEEIP